MKKLFKDLRLGAKFKTSCYQVGHCIKTGSNHANHVQGGSKKKIVVMPRAEILEL